MSKYYERFLTMASGQETPPTIPVQKKKTDWRDWQADAINKIGDEDFFRVNAPTGSGKSRLLSYLGLKKVAKGKSVLVVVPQNNIASAWGEVIDFKIERKSLKWIPKDLSKSVITVKEELINTLNSKSTPKIVICCYPSFVGLINDLKNRKKLSLLRNLFLIVDEAHHLAQAEDDGGYNGLGQALEAALPWLKSKGGGCALSTATPFRGDRLPYLSKKNVNKYFPDKPNNLYHLSLAEFFSSKDCNVQNLNYNFYLFGGSYFDGIKRAKKTGKHSIIYLPKDGHHIREGSKKQDYEEIKKIFPKPLNLLNYPGSDQKENLDKIISDSNLPVKAVITQNLMQEGFNWNPCDSIISIGYSTSITQTVQRIGRMLRNYEGKTEVTYCHLLPYTFDNKDEEQARIAFNEYLKVINASMIVAEILQPVFLPRTKRGVRQNPTLQNRKRFNKLEEIFGDVGKVAEFRGVVVKNTLLSTDSETTKQERQQVLKDHIKKELQRIGESHDPSVVEDIFLEIYIGMTRAQKLLPSGLTLENIDIWLLSDDPDPFAIFSTSDAKTFDKISGLLGEKRNWTIDDLKKIALQNQGKCLSKQFTTIIEKYKWKCKDGHIWEASGANIAGNNGKTGTWCPYCIGRNVKISDLHNYAKINGGKCINTEYINSTTKYEFECNKKHTWSASWNSMKHKKTWCPYCRGKYVTIDDCKRIGEQNGGQCLSKKYINSQSLLEWKCKNNHQWKASFSNVKNGKTWCATCIGKDKKSIEYINNLCINKGGKLLSKTYYGMRFKYKFECKYGHKWETTGSSIKHSWCLQCDRSIYTINDLKKHAITHGGHCLSNEYSGIDSKYEWKCKCGFKWKRSWNGILRKKNFCPKCAGTSKADISELQITAIKNGGKCHSTKYSNAKTKYTWECNKGHVWNAIWSSIKNGGWCPFCAGKGVINKSYNEHQNLAKKTQYKKL